jgi:hypothetical protein
MLDESLALSQMLLFFHQHVEFNIIYSYTCISHHITCNFKNLVLEVANNEKLVNNFEN